MSIPSQENKLSSTSELEPARAQMVARLQASIDQMRKELEQNLEKFMAFEIQQALRQFQNPAVSNLSSPDNSRYYRPNYSSTSLPFPPSFPFEPIHPPPELPPPSVSLPFFTTTTQSTTPYYPPMYPQNYYSEPPYSQCYQPTATPIFNTTNTHSTVTYHQHTYGENPYHTEPQMFNPHHTPHYTINQTTQTIPNFQYPFTPYQANGLAHTNDILLVHESSEIGSPRDQFEDSQQEYISVLHCPTSSSMTDLDSPNHAAQFLFDEMPLSGVNDCGEHISSEKMELLQEGKDEYGMGELQQNMADSHVPASTTVSSQINFQFCSSLRPPISSGLPPQFSPSIQHSGIDTRQNESIEKFIKKTNICYADNLFDIIPGPIICHHSKLIQAYSSHDPYHHCLSTVLPPPRPPAQPPDTSQISEISIELNSSDAQNSSVCSPVGFENRTRRIPTPVRYSSKTEDIGWAGDEALLYKIMNETHRPDKVWLHKLEADQSSDSCIYHEKDDILSPGLHASENKRYVFVACGSKNVSPVFYLDVSKPDDGLTVLIPRVSGIDVSVSHRGNRFFIQRRTPELFNSELLACPVNYISATTVLFPHRESVRIEEIKLFRDHLIIYKREKGVLKGNLHRFPAMGEPLQSLQGGQTLALIDLIYLVVLGEFDASCYVTDRIWVNSQDGTQVLIYIVYRKDLVKLDGSGPLLLYGYGPYKLCRDPSFNASRISLLDWGFVYAIAHIRGGGEMRRQWYENGKFLKKKNIFTVLIACAEYLMENKYCSEEKLSIYGGSARAMLIGAVLHMRPDLFKANIGPAISFINPSLVLITGDLTEGKSKDMLMMKTDEELWVEYKSVIDDVIERSGVDKSNFYDLKGNHDNFGVPFVGDSFDFYAKYSINGPLGRSEKVNNITIKSEERKHLLVGLDGTMSFDLQGPTNLFGHPTHQLLSKVDSKLSQWNIQSAKPVLKIRFSVQQAISSKCHGELVDQKMVQNEKAVRHLSHSRSWSWWLIMKASLFKGLHEAMHL